MSYSITPETTNIGEEAGSLVFTITRPSIDQAETLFVSTTPNQGYANNSDYVGLLNQAIPFATGQASLTIRLAINSDSLIEGNETFGIILQKFASDPVETFLARSVFTIVDNDTETAPAYSITPAGPVISEGAGTLTFTITRSLSSAAETVYVSTTPDQGSANAGDYSGLLDIPVSFAAGQTSQTVLVAINDDLAAEGSESFGIIVQRSTSDPVVTYLARTTFQIQDNDAPPPGARPVALTSYPAIGIDSIGQGNRDNDDSHAPATARQWAYDFLTPNLTDVHAVSGGVVVAVRQDLTGAFRGYGNVVTILQDGGFYTTYAHLTAFSVTVTTGMRVESGQIIAKSGDSGSFDGEELHPNLHIQFGTAISMMNANFNDASTATLIADGKGDAEAAAYFPKLTIHFDQRDDTGLSTDSDYYGTRGIDDFYGNVYANTVDGLAGNDILRGMGGNDLLRGGDGQDTLDGGSGNDTMAGGTGNDSYIVDSLGDVITEANGEGRDGVYTTMSYALQANVEDLFLNGTSNINGTGNSLGNQINGNSGANNLFGYQGNDFLAGALGNDSIRGGSGSDSITGGEGRDLLTGGTGPDIFVYSSLFDSRADRTQCDIIIDFTPGMDKIDVSAIDAMQSSIGTLQHFSFIGTLSFTAEGQVRASQSGGDTLLQFNALGASGAEMFVLLRNIDAITLTNSDFLL